MNAPKAVLGRDREYGAAEQPAARVVLRRQWIGPELVQADETEQRFLPRVEVVPDLLRAALVTVVVG